MQVHTANLKNINENQIIAFAIFERQLFDWPWPLDNWYDLAKSSRNIFVSYIQEDERILGMSVYEVTEPDFCHLYKIIVDPTRRRQGMAFSLFNEIVRCAGADLKSNFNLYLEVEETNRGAIAFYEGQGLKTVYKKPNFYKNGRAALIMQCDSCDITHDKP